MTKEGTSIRFLIDLDDIEFRIFILCFALQIPQEQVAKLLKKNKNHVCIICQQLKKLYDFELVKEEILEAFESRY